ncbi:hypothetical protein M5689_019030 [Euphorbia peplus]|nr:hypothetical protein M5689_019030 [Euphorbia peplus]
MEIDQNRPPYSNSCTIDEVDFMVSRDEIRLETIGGLEDLNINDNQPGDNGSPIGLRTKETSKVLITSRAKKAKKSDIDEEIFILSNAIESAAKAIMESNKEFVNGIAPKDLTKDCDIWKLIEELGIDPRHHDNAFTYLFEQPKKLEALNISPMNHHKRLLMKWMGRDNAFTRNYE